jgi:hypothetical protein
MAGENALSVVAGQAATSSWEEADFIEALARLENLQHQVRFQNPHYVFELALNTSLV